MCQKKKEVVGICEMEKDENMRKNKVKEKEKWNAAKGVKGNKKEARDMRNEKLN